MNRFLFLFCCLVFICGFSNLPAQPEYKLSDFIPTGDAYQIGENCYQLTNSALWQGGTIWYQTPIDLQHAFEMELDLFFGCADEGADGMVFIFHPELRNGFQGEGIGFGGLRPAFGIEMDTYHNPHLRDPHFDHIALMQNGHMHHAQSLSQAQPILINKSNIEDCKSHKVRITWDPIQENVSVYIDGLIRMNEHLDIIGRIFNGQSKVYWGISAATGGMHNEHKICLKKLEFTTPESFNTSTISRLLRGKEYTLENVDFFPGEDQYKTYSVEELDRLAALLQAHPSQHLYINGFVASLSTTEDNQKLSEQRAKAVADYLRSKGIPANRIRTLGYGEIHRHQPANSISVQFFVPRA